MSLQADAARPWQLKQTGFERGAPSSDPGIDEIGVALVRVSNRQPETIRPHRNEDEVNLIRHEPIRPHLDSGLAHLLREQSR